MSLGSPRWFAMWPSSQRRASNTTAKKAPSAGFEQVTPAEVGLHRLGYPHRAIGLLVVLQDGDDPSCGGEGAVECGHDLRFTSLVAVPDGEATSLEGGAVGGAGHLPVPPLGRNPRLAIEFAGRAGAQ